MIKAPVLLLLTWLLAGQASAAMSSAAISGVTKTGGAYTLKSPTATAANGAFNTSATVTQSGTQITMPASATFAANAASFALTAVRLNPAGLITTAVASWLLQEGLQWANNSWTKEGANAATYSVDGRAGSASQQQACLNRFSGGTLQINSGASAPWCWNSVHTLQFTVNATCPVGGPTWIVGGTATCSGTTTRAAIEDDFTVAATHPVTDGAATELVKVLDMPINAPVLNPAPVDSYSAPYLDPVSGRLVKEQTRVTPEPTASNPLNVRLEKYQVDAGNVPGQTAAPPAPTKEASISNQPLNIEFPSDYARQGEAQTAATSINDTLGPKIDKITETGADPADPLQPQGSEFDQAFFQGTFTGLLGWQLPAHTSQCPTSSFGWNNQTFTMDSHCQLVNNHFSALSTVMAVVWTVLALFILLGA